MRATTFALAVLFLAVNLVHADFYERDKVKVFYKDMGKGEPVVLIHGYLANGENQWETPKVVAALEKKYRLIILDNRGHGKSDKPTDPKKYGDEMARDVVGLMAELKLPKAHLVGYSMGSWISQKVASDKPGLVHSLTVGGAGRLGPAELNAVEKLAKGITLPGAGLLMADLLGGKLALPGDAAELRALSAAGRGAKGLQIDKSRKPYAGPVLGMIGTMDHTFKNSMDDLAMDLPQMGKAVPVPGTHLTAFESTEFHDALVKFLAANPMSKPKGGGGK